MDCGICQTIIPEKKVPACPSCEYISCEKCLRKYFETIPEPACPNCGKRWTREFITLNFKGLYRDFKKMREKFLLDQEKMLLPETQAAAETEKRARIIDTDIVHLQEDLYKARRLAETIKTQLHTKIIQSEHLRAFGRDINEGLAEGLAEGLTEGLTEGLAKHVKADSVLFGCPVEECRGFVTSAEKNCGLCGVLVCTRCELIKTDDHECKPEDVETVKTKIKETKQCPKCLTSIYKIEGCDQMWCTQCKTPFSWRSGQVVNERIHNPHFYEWQRQTNGGNAPRVEGDVPYGDQCGGIRQIQIGEITNVINTHYDIQDFNYEKLREETQNVTTLGAYFKALKRKSISKFEFFHMIVGHIQNEIRAPIRQDNKDLRIAFLLGDITEEILAKRIQQREKKTEKDLELRQIVEMLAQTANDIFIKMVTRPSERGMHNFVLSEKQKEMFSVEIDRLVAFVNEQFEIVAAKFKIKRHEITYSEGDNFEFV